MKEPLRLLRDANTPAGMRQALSAAAAAPPLSPAIRNAMSAAAAQLAARAATTGATIGSPTTTVVLQAATVKLAAKALMVVAGLGAAGGLAYVAEPFVVAAFVPEEPVSKVNPARIERATQQLGVKVTEPSVVTGIDPVSEPRAAKNPVVVVPRPSALVDRAGEAPTSSGSTIASEAKLLERARGHLTSEPALALEETNLHLDRFGTGQMSAERELIAVEALLRLGRRAEAERRAAPRLQFDPSGLYAKRLRQLLVEF